MWHSFPQATLQGARRTYHWNHFCDNIEFAGLETICHLSAQLQETKILNQKCITLVYLSLISCPLESLELLNDRDDSIWFERVPGFLCASVPAVCCRVEKAEDGFGF